MREENSEEDLAIMSDSSASKLAEKFLTTRAPNNNNLEGKDEDDRDIIKLVNQELDNENQ